MLCSAQFVNSAQNLSKDVWPSNLGGFIKCFGLDRVSSPSAELEQVKLVTSEFDTRIRVALVNLLLDALLDVLCSPLRLEEDRHFW